MGLIIILKSACRIENFVKWELQLHFLVCNHSISSPYNAGAENATFLNLDIKPVQDF
jgi:hypothetical protein